GVGHTGRAGDDADPRVRARVRSRPRSPFPALRRSRRRPEPPGHLAASAGLRGCGRPGQLSAVVGDGPGPRWAADAARHRGDDSLRSGGLPDRKAEEATPPLTTAAPAGSRAAIPTLG